MIIRVGISLLLIAASSTGHGEARATLMDADRPPEALFVGADAFYFVESEEADWYSVGAIADTAEYEEEEPAE